MPGGITEKIHVLNRDNIYKTSKVKQLNFKLAT